jgi:hypothetical protein
MECIGTTAMLGSLGLGRRASVPTPPILGSAPSSTECGVLKNLVNPTDRAASSGTLEVVLALQLVTTKAGKVLLTAPRTFKLGGSAG